MPHTIYKQLKKEFLKVEFIDKSEICFNLTALKYTKEIELIKSSKNR